MQHAQAGARRNTAHARRPLRGSRFRLGRADMRGYRAVKYVLFLFCYVFWVLSAILIAVGIYAKVAKEKDVVDTLALDPALLFMAIGSLTFVITFLGCFGALRNATCPLKMVIERTERLMMKSVVRYREDRDLDNAIDFVQKKFQCCGVDSYKDWSGNVYFECSDSNPSSEACGVPFSCCVAPGNRTVPNTMCGFGTRRASRDIFLAGCLDKIVRWLDRNIRTVAGLAGGLLLLETCVMSLALAQACWINKVRRRAAALASRRPSHKKDHLWFPAFAHFDDQRDDIATENPFPWSVQERLREVHPGSRRLGGRLGHVEEMNPNEKLSLSAKASPWTLDPEPATPCPC
ncbi:tetraspanin-33 isoform X2 [Phycodurus eques]|uniref:tetraspanin-33 isoform X2 n=1 Tax=Phycodurus eques TaxID=693459 RepID=UPI002ACF0503|nr:tetraspanin-33 isoform X2 [Phycodurus eques]